MDKSLTKRIIAFSIFWIFIALIVTALLLGRFYLGHIEEHYDAHVKTHVEELVASVETVPDGSLALIRQPTDPRFHRENSGWYWQILRGRELVARSPSLGDGRLDLQGIVFEENLNIHTVTGPDGEQLRAQVISVSYPNQPGSITIAATAPEFQIRDDVRDYYAQVFTSFLLLGIGLSVAVVIQVTLALKPLKAIATGISDIRAGKSERLPRDYPSDVQPLVDELNFLLDHNETLLKRARNQLSDLAHAVKNPLTVIRNEAREIPGRKGNLILEQSHVMDNSINHCLSRARIYGKHDAIGYRTNVKTVVDDIAFAVSQIHKKRDIDIHLANLEDKWFRGEAQDLEEMAGNLIDNACKWANREVAVSCESEHNRLTLVIEDDGPGIAEKELETITHRGRRLDESMPGHGHGLGIVKDIAQLYGGSLKLGRSGMGGLKAELDLPAA